jgi:U4/U6.U5 tri-snRNP component SNU23
MPKAAAGGGAGVGPSRRTWDKQEYTEKAKSRDDEDRERAKENQERLLKGACGVARGMSSMPATQLCG